MQVPEPVIVDTDSLKRRPLPAHPPALYTVAAVAEPIRAGEASSEAARAHYRRRGWLAVRDVWDSATVAASGGLLDELAAGREAAAAKRQLEANAGEPTAGEPMTGGDPAAARPAAGRVRKLGFSVLLAAETGLPVGEPTMLGIVRHLLDCREVELYQAMALLKPPAGGREKPWHQDHAYFDLPLGTPVVGVWIAIDAATLDNGCMHLLDGGHQAGPRPHFAIRDWQLCDADMLGVGSVAVPLAPGGALFFDGLLPHGTPTNHSEHRRRAVQLHFCPAGSRRVSKAERFSAFGDRGTFTC
jgi:phytanoyl-CoA hydroxylase